MKTRKKNIHISNKYTTKNNQNNVSLQKIKQLFSKYTDAYAEYFTRQSRLRT